MKRVKLNSFDNSWYKPGNRVLILFWYFTNLVFFKSSFPYPSNLKVSLLKLFGSKIGDNVILKPCINIKYPWNLKIGSDVWIGEDVWIDSLAGVTIEDNVVVSQGAYLLTGNHDYRKETFDLIIGRIILQEGSWVGAKSMVCPNVKLEPYSILAVGSVATVDLAENSIYQGNPAIFKKLRFRE